MNNSRVQQTKASNFLIFTYMSLIISISLLIALNSSLFSTSNSYAYLFAYLTHASNITDFINFDDILHCAVVSLMFLFITATYIFGIIYLFIRHHYTKHNLMYKMHQGELTLILEIYLFAYPLTFIYMALIQVYGYDAFQPLEYVIPALDIVVFIPILYKLIPRYVTTFWMCHMNDKRQTEKEVKRFLYLRIFVLVSLCFILYFWSNPEELMYGIIDAFSPHKFDYKWYELLAPFIISYIMLIFLVLTVILVVVWFFNRIRAEKKFIGVPIEWFKLITCLVGIFVIFIFLLSTSVIGMWANEDSFDKINLVFQVIACIFVIPAIITNLVGLITRRNNYQDMIKLSKQGQ